MELKKITKEIFCANYIGLYNSKARETERHRERERERERERQRERERNG